MWRAVLTSGPLLKTAALVLMVIYVSGSNKMNANESTSGSCVSECASSTISSVSVQIGDKGLFPAHFTNIQFPLIFNRNVSVYWHIHVYVSAYLRASANTYLLLFRLSGICKNLFPDPDRLC